MNRNRENGYLREFQDAVIVSDSIKAFDGGEEEGGGSVVS